MASPRPKHQAMGIIAHLISFKGLGQVAPALAGVPERKQEQKHGEQDGTAAQSRAGYLAI